MNLIPVQTFCSKAFTLFDEDWFLLTSGDFASGRFNTMTISWGSLGTLWNKPVAQVVVRPTRHTFSFLESFTDFSLCSFSREYRRALQFLGTRSGRDGDKIADVPITPIAADTIHSPVFSEANLIIECRKIYSDDLHAERFLDPSIAAQYPDRDFHRLYIGEVLQVKGEAAFRC
jgi:flavin reductase (DIM6/NTAB) family NADH-FMN oxidoreductase RutF